MKSVHVSVRGRVQGVAFRDATRTRACELGVVGWVRNRADGSVEAHFQGEGGAVDALVAFARVGPPLARVEGLEVARVAPDFALSSFEIR